MYLKNLEFYSGSGYKQSGFLKKWKEKLLVFNLNTKVVIDGIFRYYKYKMQRIKHKNK